MSKAKVAIVVDSTAYIPPALVAQYNIHVIPQILNWEGSSLRDDIDIKPDAFYARLATAKEMPTTSQPSAGEFHEFFSKVAETADSIVAILISKSLSGTQASAQAAAGMMEDYPIEIVDSQSSTMGLGYMVLTAARAIENGADYKTAAEVARALVADMRVLFVVDTLEFLHRGGRIGGAQRFIGSMLSIKPILNLVDGKIEPLASVRTKKKALAHLLNVAETEMAGKSNIKAAVMHAAAANDAQKLHDQLKQKLNPTELHIVELSPVIGAHVGPLALGLVYYGS
ncbi:DegV family protein [hydrothermal vent metagenome]|uniref:DegV family protein n=1 Tax=hydrothermal vent metagenome TaxID=652676 RepID=A0A3B0V5T6_9ZZZZ